MAIDILQAKQLLEQQISGLATGTGVSFSDKSIIIYVTDYNKESEIRSRVGNSFEGFAIKYVVSGKVTSLSFQ